MAGQHNNKKIHIEHEILQHAIEAFKKNVQLEIEIKERQPATEDQRIDYVLHTVIQGRKTIFAADVKATITRANSNMYVLLKNKYPKNLLLVTRYVNARLAEHLKQNGIEFIDAAGNAFIDQPPLYIFINGNKPSEAMKKIPQGRAFKPTGLRVIFFFLCNRGLENKPYRDIAAAATVALGTVGWLMRELKESGYLLDMGDRGKKIVQREKLFQRWVAEYPEKLKPKQFIGRYQGEKNWWQQKKLDHVHALWGGEVAAAKLTQYLKPETVTIYTTRQFLNQFLLENKLKREPNGDVEILERFWQPDMKMPFKDIVHPVLIYADLLATGNERNIETARMVYAQHIAGLIREDGFIT